MHKSQIHESVLKLGEDATFNARTVLEWVDYNKKLLPSLKRKVRYRQELKTKWKVKTK